MGDFRVTLEGIGGHGCDRKAKEGDQVNGCGKMDCPDCVTAAYFAQMKRIGSVQKATFHHWPADMVDHILTKDGKCIRCGWDPKSEDPRFSEPRPCRTYPAEHEVIDDYSEREVKYPGLMMAVGKRVKGHF